MRGLRVVGAALLIPGLLGTAAVVPGASAAPEDGGRWTAEQPAAPAQAREGGAGAVDASVVSVAGRTVLTSGKLRGGSKKAPTEPAPLEPVVTEPVTTSPVTTQPVATEPVATAPAPAEPVAAEPLTTEPAASEPVTTQPVATTSSTSSTSTTTSTTPSTATGPEPDPVVTVRRTVPFGVTIPWGPLKRDALAATTAATGVPPTHLQWYTGFGEAPDVAKLQAVTDAGAVPVVTWEPWAYTDGVVQPRYSLATFARGDHDAYLRQWADALAAWDGPVMIRFAHEMNGSWYPWAAGVNGNSAAQYVAAWRHVHDLFTARGAHRVQWVWAPNVVYPGSTALTSLYPGDAYVDVVGVDGYNWGTTRSWESWKSPEQVFGPTVAELRALAPRKPLLVTETASTEVGGDKAAWVTELFSWAAAQPDVTGVIWFDEDKETDWRISSSAASEAAFRGALAPAP